MVCKMVKKGVLGAALGAGVLATSVRHGGSLLCTHGGQQGAGYR